MASFINHGKDLAINGTQYLWNAGSSFIADYTSQEVRNRVVKVAVSATDVVANAALLFFGAYVVVQCCSCLRGRVAPAGNTGPQGVNQPGVAWNTLGNTHEERLANFHARAASGALTPEMLAAFIEAGVALDATDNSGKSALHFAANNGQTQTINRLLEAGAQVDLPDLLGNTPLHRAAAAGHDAAAQALLEAGANPGAKNSDERTPLHLSAGKSPALLANLLEFVEQRGDISVTEYVNAVDVDGQTIAHVVAKSAFEVDAFATPPVPALATPAMNALALPAQAQEMAPSFPSFPLAEPREPDMEIFSALEKAGADFSLMDIWGNTPITLACLHGRKNAAVFLYDRVDVRTPNLLGELPIHTLLLMGHKELARELISSGKVDIDRPLGVITKENLSMMEQRLVFMREQVRELQLTGDRSGMFRQQIEMVRKLLAETDQNNGIRINQLTHLLNVQVELHGVANPRIRKLMQNISLLESLEKRLSAEEVSEDGLGEIVPLGWTPAHYAAFAGDTHTLALLKSKGADMKALDGMQRSAFSIALDHESSAISFFVRNLSQSEVEEFRTEEDLSLIEYAVVHDNVPLRAFLNEREITFEPSEERIQELIRPALKIVYDFAATLKEPEILKIKEFESAREALRKYVAGDDSAIQSNLWLQKIAIDIRASLQKAAAEGAAKTSGTYAPYTELYPFNVNLYRLIKGNFIRILGENPFDSKILKRLISQLLPTDPTLNQIPPILMPYLQRVHSVEVMGKLIKAATTLGVSAPYHFAEWELPETLSEVELSPAILRDFAPEINQFLGLEIPADALVFENESTRIYQDIVDKFSPLLKLIGFRIPENFVETHRLPVRDLYKAFAGRKAEVMPLIETWFQLQTMNEGGQVHLSAFVLASFSPILEKAGLSGIPTDPMDIENRHYALVATALKRKKIQVPSDFSTAHQLPKGTVLRVMNMLAELATPEEVEAVDEHSDSDEGAGPSL